MGDPVGKSELLDHQPELKPTLALREPYLAPAFYLKVDLLRRIRAAEKSGEVDCELRRAMLLTIKVVAPTCGARVSRPWAVAGSAPDDVGGRKTGSCRGL